MNPAHEPTLYSRSRQWSDSTQQTKRLLRSSMTRAIVDVTKRKVAEYFGDVKSHRILPASNLDMTTSSISLVIQGKTANAAVQFVVSPGSLAGILYEAYKSCRTDADYRDFVLKRLWPYAQITTTSSTSAPRELKKAREAGGDIAVPVPQLRAGKVLSEGVLLDDTTSIKL